MTSGTRSSEFLLTALVFGVLLMAEQVGIKLDDQTRLALIGIVGSYSVSRGIAKIGNTTTPSISQPTSDAPATSPRRKAAVKKASPRRRAANK